MKCKGIATHCNNKVEPAERQAFNSLNKKSMMQKLNLEKRMLADIKANDNNPRKISDSKFRKLVDSLLIFPKMMSLRPIVLDKTLILGGNMRYKALNFISQLSENEILNKIKNIREFDNKNKREQNEILDFWKIWIDKPFAFTIQTTDLSDYEKKEFIIKDNASFGEWDFATLKTDWNEIELDNWGVDLTWSGVEIGNNVENDSTYSHTEEVETNNINTSDNDSLQNEFPTKNITEYEDITVLKDKSGNFIQAPLPFQGQKRRFLTYIKEILPLFKDKKIFVDLFGGSGLISHTIKRARPDARVIYNDFDNYIERLENVAKTNKLLNDINYILRYCYKNKTLKPDERIDREVGDKIFKRIKQEEGYVDYITLSASLSFSGRCCKSLEELEQKDIYNHIVQSKYDTKGYLQDVEVTHLDYKVLFEQYKNNPNVCFIADPPYFNTDNSGYSSGEEWSCSDFLDVINILQNVSYMYFTSNKTNIIEICKWIGENTNWKNPFLSAEIKTTRGNVNFAASYIDIMLYSNK